MADKKPVPWVAIKKRYLKGEKPKAIADDYGLTSKQIRDKASVEGWARQKSAIIDKIEDKVFSELDELYSLYTHHVIDTGKQLKQAREAGLIGLTIQDGEGYSSKFADNDQKTGLALLVERVKHSNKLELAKMTQEDKNKQDGPQASSPVYRSIYKGGDFNAPSDGNFASKAILPVESGDSGSPEWEDDGSD